MSSVTYDFLKAAKTLMDTRALILAGQTGDKIASVSRRGEHIDAGVLKDRKTLVITGSSGVGDYLFYNLRPLRPLPKMPEIDRICRNFPKRAYHKGFLLHAARVLEFLRKDHGADPHFIIGHSLGAAAAQILGETLNVPTICFASPQVVKKRFLEDDDKRLADHPQWKVFNVAWNKDFVTRGYRLTGLRSLGHRIILKNDEVFNLGIDHFVSQYEDLVYMDSKAEERQLPAKWFDPHYPVPAKVAPGWR